MARKKKSRKVHHRRRRMGGVSGGLQTLAGAAVGAVAASFVKKMLPATLDPKIIGAGEIAIGFLAPKFAKGNALITGIGYGFAARGAIDLSTSLGLISGVRLPSDAFVKPAGMLNNSISGRRRVGSMSRPIGAMRDLATIGALTEN